MLTLPTTLSRLCLFAAFPAFVLILSGCDNQSDQSPAKKYEVAESPTEITDTSPTEPENPSIVERAMERAQTIPNEPAETAATLAVVENEHDKWHQNFEQAMAIAQKEGKDIMMDFTGSDWCSWCIRLHNEVFQYQKFHDFADEHLVLLELDFPNDKSHMTEEIIAQNNKLQARFGIQGFPTILLLDSAGRPYGKTGYQPGGPEVYVEHLTDLQEARTARDAALKEAESLEGVERAKKLAEALEALDPGMIYPAYESEIAQIVELDADNSAELKDKYVEIQLAGKMQSVMGQMQSLSQEGRFEDVLALAEDQLKDEALSKKNRDRFLTIRYSMLRQLEQNDEALATLDELIDAAGERADSRAQMLVNKSEFLVSLERIAEARETFAAAREGDISPQVRSALDRIEQQLFAAVDQKEETSDGESTPSDSPESDAPGKDAADPDTSDSDAPVTSDSPDSDSPDSDSPDSDSPESETPETDAPASEPKEKGDDSGE